MIEIEAYSIKAPRISSIAVISSSTSSARADLASASHLGSACTLGKFVTLQADGEDVYFFFNNSDAGTADETATSGANRTFCLKAGIPQSFVLQDGYTWLVHKAAAATTIRAYVSSFDGQGR